MTRHKQGWTRHVLDESERARESYRRSRERAREEQAEREQAEREQAERERAAKAKREREARARRERAAKKRAAKKRAAEKRARQAAKKRAAKKRAAEKRARQAAKKRAAKKQSTPQATSPTKPPALSPGQRDSPVWRETIVPHFDPLAEKNGPFPSLGSASEAVRLYLEGQNLNQMDPRTRERWIKKNRPDWFKWA